jgi:hypothetical protein
MNKMCENIKPAGEKPAEYLAGFDILQARSMLCSKGLIILKIKECHCKERSDEAMTNKICIYKCL